MLTVFAVTVPDERRSLQDVLFIGHDTILYHRCGSGQNESCVSLHKVITSTAIKTPSSA